MKLFLSALILLAIQANAQVIKLKGRVLTGNNLPVGNALVQFNSSNILTDSLGYFHATVSSISNKINVKVSSVGFYEYQRQILIPASGLLNINLQSSLENLNEVVVTGTMRAVQRSESPIPVEIITPKLFQKNPVPALFEAVGMINGVQPQINCNVCNTGDIHINGMEGPYTLVLIDGMPIVSGLSTVYGLNGIPNSLVERVEVVKGPASSLYGSEAMGGVINVITKSATKAPKFSAEVMATSWAEVTADVSFKTQSKQWNQLLGISYFNYGKIIDNNGDGFTDATLQNRISIFSKHQFIRKDSRIASFAARYVFEDRWGGQTNWTNAFKGTDSIYGEAITTNRIELIGMYQLPVKEKIIAQISYNKHLQDSWYGTAKYYAEQQVLFAQLYWNKTVNNNYNFLLGSSIKNIVYDDNTPATASISGKDNQPSKTFLPGLFFQNEFKFKNTHLLLGYRYDYDKQHGNIHSPRIGIKYSKNYRHTLRFSAATGFRVVNLFTEEHAALTGAREVVVTENILPERSINSNLNYVYKATASFAHINVDATAFYTHFTNKIIGDFDADPNKIIYSNLKGYAVSRGISLNTDINFFALPLKAMLGVTYMDVFRVDEKGNVKLKSQQIHAPKWSGNWVLSYQFKKDWAIDFTGKWNGSMRLPIFPNDFRPEYSPLYALANIQLTKKFVNGLECYGGIKNLFNFVPDNPLLRPFDPFDKHVNDPINNPNNYTFDTEYNYAPMQSIRLFIGFRCSLK